jgi:hypothetical protein
MVADVCPAWVVKVTQIRTHAVDGTPLNTDPAPETLVTVIPEAVVPPVVFNHVPPLNAAKRIYWFPPDGART